MSKMIVKIPNGYLVAEKKGTENEYPGVLVFFSKDGEHYSTDDIVACVEYDTLEEVIKTETYVKGQEDPTNIVCWKDEDNEFDTEKESERKLHYYELSFFHDEDDNLASDDRISFCIKTDIPPVISDEVALKILFGENPTKYEKVLMENLTCIQEISEAEAVLDYMSDVWTERVESDFGIFYR